jgi:hypothetical protein
MSLGPETRKWMTRRKTSRRNGQKKTERNPARTTAMR